MIRFSLICLRILFFVFVIIFRVTKQFLADCIGSSAGDDGGNWYGVCYMSFNEALIDICIYFESARLNFNFNKLFSTQSPVP